ncbi:MAG TPA: hypothetical protein VHE37_17310 [Nevskiaceae bacterium]|nr:hypothetical protein [Nevskiaceae bacterium]
MKINADAVVTNLDGEPLHEGKTAKGEPRQLTVGRAIVNALLADYPNEQATGDEKLRRYTLAKKFHAGGEVDVKAESAALIKQLVPRAWAPMVVGPVFEAIDGQAGE